jgi:hypothetical protein
VATSIKTHYPSIEFDPAPLMASTGSKKGSSSKGRKSDSAQHTSLSLRHRDMAARLVRAVCGAEERGLVAYFADDAYAGKDAVLGPMRHLLETLPGAVEEALLETFGEDSNEGVDVPLFFPEVATSAPPDTSSATTTLQVNITSSAAHRMIVCL